MMSENQQITRMQDSITLRPAPVVRKPKAQVLDVIVESAPLTVMAVKTARGKIGFKCEARTKKVADPDEMASIAYRIQASVNPHYMELARERQRRYYQNHREEILAKKKAQRKQQA